jgi:hypothetical protein
MIATWIRQDPALRSWWKWACLLSGNILLFLGIGIFIQHRFLTVGATRITWGYVYWALLIWLAVMTFLLSPPARRRCNLIAMGLPVPVRTLWLAHTAAVLLGGLGLAALSLGIVVPAYRMTLFLQTDRAVVMDPGFPFLFAHLTGGITLAVAVLMSREPDLQQVPFTRRILPFLLFCVLGIPALILGLSTLPWPFAATLYLIAAIVGVRRYRTLPPAFAAAPREAVAVSARKRPETASAADGERPGSDLRGLRLYSRIYRILTLHPFFALIPFPFILGIGMLLSEFSYSWMDEEDLRFTFIPLTGFMLMSFLVIHLNQLHMVDGLPVSRRRLFAMLMVPAFGTLALGYGAGDLIIGTLVPTQKLIDYREKASNFYLYVPYRACEIAWDGDLPYLQSPWGESHLPATSTPLIRGSRAMMYTPFSTPPGSSPDFVALQMSRAIEALYGRTVPYEELRDRYLESAGPGRTVLKTSGFNLLDDYPDLRPVGRDAVFPVIFLGSGLFFFIFYSLYLQTFRAGVTESFRKGIFILLILITMGIHMSQFVAAILGWIHLGAINATYRVVLHNLSIAAPGGAVTIWLVCGALFATGYLFTQWRFMKVEAPVVPAKCFWMLGV